MIGAKRREGATRPSREPQGDGMESLMKDSRLWEVADLITAMVGSRMLDNGVP